MRERDLTIKVKRFSRRTRLPSASASSFSFAWVDPQDAVHAVANYEERLYTDVQLAVPRRSAGLDDPRRDSPPTGIGSARISSATSTRTAATYGVTIARADVKDLIFPGNLQEIMNKVLAAERTSQAQLVEGRERGPNCRRSTPRQKERRPDCWPSRRHKPSGWPPSPRPRPCGSRPRRKAQIIPLREQTAAAFEKHPALLRLRELESLRELAQSSVARIYVDFDRRARQDAVRPDEA